MRRTIVIVAAWIVGAGCQAFLSLDPENRARSNDASSDDASSVEATADVAADAASDAGSEEDADTPGKGIIVRDVVTRAVLPTNNVSFPKPPHMREGDFLVVMIDGHETGGAKAFVDASTPFSAEALLEAQGPSTPCGLGGDTHAFYVATRRATASEPDKYEFVMELADRTSGVLTAIGRVAEPPIDRSWSQERILIDRDGGKVSRYVTASMVTFTDDTLLVFGGFDMGGGMWTMTDPDSGAKVGTVYKDDAFIGLFTEPLAKAGAAPQRSLNLTSDCDSNGAYYVMALRPK